MSDSNNSQPITLASLSMADRLALLAELKAAEKAAREARKAQTAERRTFLTSFVSIVQQKFGASEQTFKSGAQGFSFGGANLDVPQADGSTRKAHINILIRWSDTIPASTKGDSTAADMAEGDND